MMAVNGGQLFNRSIYLTRILNNACQTKRNIRISNVLKDVQVKMPALSPTMTTGTIVKWNKKEGDSVASGDVLCEVQTDKAIVAMEIDDEGVLAKIIVPENTPDVSVGRLIALIVDEGKDWKNVTVPADAVVPATATESTASSPLVKDKPQQEAVDSVSHAESTTGERIIGPATRLLLQTYQIDAKNISKSSHRRVLLKSDVLNHITVNKLSPKPYVDEPKVEKTTPSAAGAPSPALPIIRPKAATVAPKSGYFVDLPVSADKKTKADQLLSSKFHTPHAYNRIRICMDDVANAMDRLRKDGVVLNYGDFVVKACASALREVPQVNVYFDGENIRNNATVDIALYIENYSDAFLTPVLRNADFLRVTQISEAIQAVLSLIESKNLSKLDMNQAPFGFSDGSTYGLQEFTAILKAPQTAVLCLGSVTEEFNVNLKPTRRCVATLAYDNRAISDETAGRFLNALNANLEDCSRMILGLSQSVASGVH